MAENALAAPPSGASPSPAVRLRIAKPARRARAKNPDTHKPLRCPYPECKLKANLYMGHRLLKKHMETHYGILDGRCLKCDREFNLPTPLRNHCKQKCGPQYLPERWLPKKGAAKLEWEALLASPEELVTALQQAAEEEEEQLQPEQQQQTALLCKEALEREEEEQQGQQLTPPPGAPPAAD